MSAPEAGAPGCGSCSAVPEFDGVSGSCRYSTLYQSEFLVVLADCKYGASTS